MQSIKSQASSLATSLGLEPCDPLWKRAPTRDKQGNYLSDFMILIPQLNKREKQYISRTIDKLTQVLAQYSDIIVFADLNIKINVLWISLKPVKGMCLEIPAAIKVAVPEAVLVSENHE